MPEHYDFNAPEKRYRGDYINEFNWLEINILGFKHGDLTFDQLINLFEKVIQQQGLVKKFSERYKDAEIPGGLKEQIEKTDALADRANEILNDLLVSKDARQIDELLKVVNEALKIIRL